MRFPKNARAVVGVVGGVAAAIVLASTVSPSSADARAKRGGPFRLVDVSVGGFDGVHQNAVVEFTFTSTVDPATINHAVFQIRQKNATGTGFTKQVPGTFQAAGSMVRFFPRLPTHLRDPGSLTGDFYQPGTALDDAQENAGFKPATDYQCRVVGAPSVQAARSTKGRRLEKSYQVRFRTSDETPKAYAYTIDTYGDAPPPGFQYSNPSDKVASVEDQYAKHGGTNDVPSAISVTLFGNRVPLSPSSVRAGSNVALRLTERFGDPSLAKSIPGNPFVEQSFDTTLLAYKPQFPLPDRAVYALRVTKDVKDLTEQYDFRNNPERLRLRDIYEYLAAAQALAPGLPPEQLPPPPPEYIFDWPSDPAAQGVLKRNVLELGSTYPEEVDPRVMVLFSTRDEPVTNGSISLEFVKSDGYHDDVLSTASWDEIVPGAAAAIQTIAGGSGADGDYIPGSSQTINVETFTNRTVNWRRLRIPPGVVITITGNRPATIKALEIQIDGEIRADGKAGDNGNTGTYTTLPTKPALVKGGAGGPGGGAGGDSTNEWKADASGVNYNAKANGIGQTGRPGVDVNGTEAILGDGGQGGLGGSMGSGTYYCFGAAGGGGGARTAGTAGATGGYTYYPSWNGTGGNGGAGSSNDDLDPLVGGAGGGAGGNSLFAYTSYNWAKNAGGGGGGGGALLIQTSAVFNVSSTGIIRSRGGVGGNGTGSASTVNAGPGGGGGGGSLLLRSSKGFSLAAPTTFYDVRGGSGGTHTGSYVSSPGGTGGTGYVRIEDPNGGVQVPGGSVGSYDPIGGGVASYIYTKWIDLGVDQPRLLNFTEDDFLHSAAGNDALLIEMQMAIEDPNNFGSPLLSSLNPDQSSGNVDEVSAWAGVRVTDQTGIPGGAFGSIPDYDPSIHGTDYVIPVADKLNGKNFKFFRVRVTFQLDGSQSSRDSFPYLDRLTLNFQFNT